MLGLWDTLVSKASSFVLYSPRLKNYAVRLSNTNFVIRNPIYGYMHDKQVQLLMKKCERVPLHIMIENTNACNYHCSFCPHENMRREIGFMDMRLYKKIMDECAELRIEYVDIHQFGEPLMDPDFTKRVAYAKSKGIKFVTTNTNGLLLREDLARKLVDAKLDQIIISLDAATKETYRKVRPPGKLEVVERNIKNLIKIRNSLGFTRPRVVVDFVQQLENRSEVKLFVKKWKNVADKVMISYMHDWAGSVDKQPFELHGNPAREPCRLIWSEMVVAWDGKVMLCCVDYVGEVVLGDLRAQSLDEVWKGEKLRIIRKAHIEGKLEEIPICTRCSYRTTWWISK
jgi:radical SAM protein with 4Fe4S-binding SPASM domain